MTRERILQLREKLVKAALNLSDEDAFYCPEFFISWKPNVQYKKDERLRYGEVLYKVLQDHTSQADWTPDTAVSLYVAIPDPAIEYPEWVQPTGAHDAYMKGDKVSHLEKHWVSDIDNNVYEPSVYGWSEV